MKVRLLALAAITAALLCGSWFDGHQALALTIDSPVVCDAYPNQPWLCSPNTATFADWNYIYGVNTGYDVAGPDGPAWDSANEADADSIANFSSLFHYGSSTVPFEIPCTATMGTKWLGPTGGYWYVRGSVRAACDAVSNFNITVCLQRKAPSSTTWSFMGCHSPATGLERISFTARGEHRCRSVVSTYQWRVEGLIYVYSPPNWYGWKVGGSRTKTYYCA